MEPAQLDTKPLTSAELRAMSAQYADNPKINSVIEEAIKRRLSEVVK